MRSPTRFCFTASLCCWFIASLEAQTNYATSLVNPFIGTGGHGHTFPGACVPNGLVQLSPDTRPDGNFDWDGCGGYHYSDSLIYGFSHTHLSGTGVADLCDVLLMPMSEKYSVDPAEYRSRFIHEKESAHAGYYSVFLEDEGTKVELTATAHCGMHRYTMPKEAEQFIVLDLLHRDELRNARIARNGQEITGERRSASWAKDQRLFYCIRIARESGPCGFGMETLDSTRAVINVKRESTAPIIVKVGISAVSIEGARANLDAEIPGWDFDAVRKKAEDGWNAKLGKIQVAGGTPEQQRIFYTALYHCYVAPYIFNDVDGKYRGMDGEVHHADHNVYTVFSLWDTFRALHPLMTILEPEMTSDFIKTFLLHYKDGGRLPVWELWGNETDCMIGYHSASVIADAYMKGIRDFDTELALEAMLASANCDEPGLNAYRTKGYISSEDQSESVSRTLEYAYDDWCIAQMAKEMGRDSIAVVFYNRSRNWQNLFDPETKFFRARRNGGFAEPFDPFEVNFHFTEANAWQYSMFVPHDLLKFSEYFGGMDSLSGRLDLLFSTDSKTTGRDQSDISGMIGQYAHGNEPSHHMAYLNGAGKGNLRARKILNELYHDAPDGLSGNEDCGQMSAWYVLSSIGLYPVAPGCDRYWTGISLFDEVDAEAGDGKRYRTYARSMTDNRSIREEVQPWPSLSHKEILGGMNFSISDGPYPGWAQKPSPFRSDLEVSPVPIISAPSATFRDSIVVNVTSIPGTLPIKVQWKWKDDDQIFVGSGDKPVVLYNSGSVRAWIPEEDDGLGVNAISVVARFTKIDGDVTIKLGTPYANQYAAGGDNALIDGQRGGRDFRTGEWQGTQGQDVLATIDLGRVKKLKRIGVGMLQDQASWIFYPELIEVAWSSTGRTWSSTAVKNPVKRDADGSMIMDLFTEAIDKKAQFIKIRVQNGGVCPEWHRGKGGASWLFLDEVLIEAE